MHEYALAQNIIDTIKEQVTAELEKITKITMEVGAFSGVVPESLEFGMQSILADANVPNVVIDITKVTTVAQCKCGREYQIEEIFESCPDCSSYERKMISGMDIVIHSVEVRDDDATETGHPQEKTS